MLGSSGFRGGNTPYLVPGRRRVNRERTRRSAEGALPPEGRKEAQDLGTSHFETLAPSHYFEFKKFKIKIRACGENVRPMEDLKKRLEKLQFGGIVEILQEPSPFLRCELTGNRMKIRIHCYALRAEAPGNK